MERTLYIVKRTGEVTQKTAIHATAAAKLCIGKTGLLQTLSISAAAGCGLIRSIRAFIVIYDATRQM